MDNEWLDSLLHQQKTPEEKRRLLQMDRNEIAHRVRALVSEHLDVDISQVTETTKLVDDLGADSLDQAELVMEVEDEFDLDIPEDEEKADTVGSIVTFVEQGLAKQKKAQTT